MDSFKLPDHAPRWARVLGLRIDWQSRPTDRSRTYHSDNRKVELVVGRLGNRWAFEVSQYEEYTTLHAGGPWLHLHWRIGPGRVPPPGDMSRDWGWYVHEGYFRLSWGTRGKGFEINPFRWSRYESKRLTADGKWDATRPWSEAGKAIEWYSETHPYAIASSPHYCMSDYTGRRFQIETWEAQATCYVERVTRTRRWLPFWRRIEHWVYFDLSDEVGRGKGSWKGGTVGFSEELLPGDRVEDVVQRAAAKGRGR